MNQESVLKELEALFNPVFIELNYELYYLEYIKENGENYLRVYIEKPNDKVDFKDCEVISRRVNELFDEKQMEKKIDVDYLEVSSPGIYRTLHNDIHFNKVLNKKIRVILKSPVENLKKIEGILKEVKMDEIIVENKGNDISIPKDKIKSANLEGDI
ncbi:MAG: ribosome maturation factor RimP [Sarcina sp.]